MKSRLLHPERILVKQTCITASCDNVGGLDEHVTCHVLVSKDTRAFLMCSDAQNVQ